MKGCVCWNPRPGTGHIADAIRAEFPFIQIDTVEIQPKRPAKVLALKNYRVMGYDFLEWQPTDLCMTALLMNPPFERQADIDHVRKAYSLLAPDGVLVSVMSPSFEFRKDRKSTDFRAWLESVNASWEPLPEGSFKASGTGVGTRLVIIER